MKLDGLKAMTQRRGKNQRQKRAKPVKPRTPKIAEPTPERKAMGLAVKKPVHHYEDGTKREIWVIESWVAMMHRREKLTDDQARVLQKYKDQWDIANRSPIKCNLNRTLSSGEGESFAYMQARKNLNHWDARLGRVAVKELVLVACHCLGYEGAARALFGESATSSDARRIRNRLLDNTIPALDNFMR